MSSDALSCKRYYARLRREREEQRQTRSDGGNIAVSFKTWLFYERGITDWTQMKRYDLWNAYLDYRAHCAEMNMLFDSGKVYGLDNT